MYSHLLHSHLLQSLGNAIIHSLWQSLVLLLIYKAVTALKKDLQPAAKHNISAIFVLLTFGWFAYTFQSNYFVKDLSGVAPDLNTGIPEPASYSLVNIPSEMSAALSVAYLFLLSFLVTRLAFTISKTLRFHTSGLLPVDDTLQVFTKHAAGLLNIKRKVTVWIGNNISVPATVGFIKPVILLPAVCLTHLSPQQIEAIILHELSHIRRNDFLINLLLVTIETILFFNPAVFVFMKIIRTERENCCDDLVLKNNYEPLHYAKALLTFSKVQLQQTLAMNAASRKHQLLHRIKRITGGNIERPVFFSGRIALFALMALMFFSFAVFENKIKQSEAIAPVAVSKNIKITGKDILSNSEKIEAEVHKVPRKKETKEAPKPTEKKFKNFSHFANEVSESVKDVINLKTLTTNLPDEKVLMALGKNASEQIEKVMSQLTDRELQVLIQQKQDLWDEKRIEEQLKAAEEYRKHAEKMYEFSFSGDSVYFHTAPKNIIVEGRKVPVPMKEKKIIVSPEKRTRVNINSVRRLRTVNI